jgi:hypothetical protein
MLHSDTAHVVAAIAARDDAIRAEERERLLGKFSVICREHATVGSVYAAMSAVLLEHRTRAQPAERAKETGDE